MPRNPILSIVKLEQILERQRGELKALHRERDRLQRQLGVLDNKIRGLAGKSGSLLGLGRTERASNEKGLVATLEDVLAKRGQPMKVGDIVDAVLESGYRSNAANFRALVNQTLIRERKRFANTERATYQVKK